MRASGVRILVVVLFTSVVFAVGLLTKAKAQPLLTKYHLKLAAYYRQEAARFAAQAAEHDEMREYYTKQLLPLDGKMPYNAEMPKHCARTARDLRKAAEGAKGLAAGHDEVAHAAGKK